MHISKITQTWTQEIPQANNDVWFYSTWEKVATPTDIMINSYPDSEQGLGNISFTEKPIILQTIFLSLMQCCGK